MKNLIIKKILDYNFFDLMDEQGNRYSLQLEFYGLPKIKVGDKILFKDEKMLDKNSQSFCSLYAFEFAKNATAEQFKSDPDITYVKIGKSKFFIKRIYG